MKLAKLLMFFVVISVAGALMASAQYLGLPDQNPEASLPSADLPSTDLPSAASQTPAPLPDFAAYGDTPARKQAFVEYMLPLLRQGNRLIVAERAQLTEMQLRLSSGWSLTHAQQSELDQMAVKYRVKGAETTKELLASLLVRVDVVPASLVLAQAAAESGWGTSRFAREGNNLFGIACFSPGCGLTPKRRKAGHTNEVSTYASVQDSVHAYILTLNSHSAYEQLREARAQTRQDNQNMTGLALAEGLIRYSIRGMDYVKSIQTIIRANNLQRYTVATRA
ncbi:MAG: glucosaminidase domain-containing protein [Pseudomonadales bacterium]